MARTPGKTSPVAQATPPCATQRPSRQVDSRREIGPAARSRAPLEDALGGVDLDWPRCLKPSARARCRCRPWGVGCLAGLTAARCLCRLLFVYKKLVELAPRSSCVGGRVLFPVPAICCGCRVCLGPLRIRPRAFCRRKSRPSEGGRLMFHCLRMWSPRSSSGTRGSGLRPKRAVLSMVSRRL